MEPDPVLDLLEQTPAAVEQLIAGLNHSQLCFKPALDLFSITENILHLRDIDVEGYAARVHRVVDLEQPFLPDIDGSKLAIQRRYNEQDPVTALQELGASRRASVLTLRRLDSDQFHRTARMEGVGTITLKKLLEMWQEHDQAHLDELKGLVELARSNLPG